MRHTVRTNLAAVVAEGLTKPTSMLSVTRIEQSLAVVAHLSAGVPRYWLLDSSALEAAGTVARPVGPTGRHGRSGAASGVPGQFQPSSNVARYVVWMISSH
jgi:hypothetical protein